MHNVKCAVPRVRSAASNGNITPKTAALMPLIDWAAITGYAPAGRRAGRRAPAERPSPAAGAAGGPTAVRRVANPRRAQRHHALRQHDAGGDDQVGEITRTHGHRCGGQRQHRRIGQMEQQHAGGKDQQTPVHEQRAQAPPVQQSRVDLCRGRRRGSRPTPPAPARRARPSARTPKRLDSQAPLAPITAAVMPLPMEAKRALRPSRSPSAA